MATITLQRRLHNELYEVTGFISRLRNLVPSRVKLHLLQYRHEFTFSPVKGQGQPEIFWNTDAECWDADDAWEERKPFKWMKQPESSSQTWTLLWENLIIHRVDQSSVKQKFQHMIRKRFGKDFK